MSLDGPAATVLLLLARLAPLGICLAWFSRGLFGVTVSASLVLALAVFFAPDATVAHAHPGLVWPLWLVSLLREFCLGTLVALALSLPLVALSFAARFAEFTSSLGLRNRAGAITLLYALAVGSLCLSLGLHRSLVLALNESLQMAPLHGSGFSAQSWAMGVVQLVSTTLALSVALALPLLLSTWLLEVIFSVFSRVAGQTWFGAESALKGPLFVLLALGLLGPAVAEVPGALRVFHRLMRELTQSAVR